MIVQVCVGSSCHLKGSAQIVELLQKAVAENNLDGEVTLAGSFCIGKCNRAIATSSMHIVKTISGNAGSLMTVSSLHEGEYGLKDVCLSSLSIVDYSEAF